jgi:hypothetical protein
MRGQWIKLALIALMSMLIIVGCGSKAVTFPTGIFTKANWTWEINADGSYYSHSQVATEHGTYTVTGNQIVIVGDIPCEGIKGSYTWAYDGKELIFEPIDDQCTDRRNFTRGTWRKNP